MARYALFPRILGCPRRRAFNADGSRVVIVLRPASVTGRQQVIMTPGQQTRGSGPVTAWGMAGSPGLVSGAAEARMAAPPSTAAASPKAAP
jgi:hypothetical protein